MIKDMTISEICKISGLAPHTLRFYEKHFPKLLSPKRTPGGHRIYSPHHVDSIRLIFREIREKKLSIQEARQTLGEVLSAEVSPSAQNFPPKHHSLDSIDSIMGKLEELTKMYGRLDQVVDTLLKERGQKKREDLLYQICHLRRENQEMVSILEKLSERNSPSSGMA